MKKMWLIAFLIFLYGCTNTLEYKGNDMREDKYQGDFLRVGVVGSKELSNVGNVEYEYVELSKLSGEKKEFDALIITPKAFMEADKSSYVSFYNKVEYPVFFFGIEGFKMFAFTNKNMSIENSKNDNSAYVMGFKNVDGEKQGVEFYKSEQSHTDIYMLIRIFDYVNQKF